MARKVKIGSKDADVTLENQFGFQGNKRRKFGYDPRATEAVPAEEKDPQNQQPQNLYQPVSNQLLHASLLQDTEAGILDVREAIVVEQEREQPVSELTQPTVTPRPTTNQGIPVQQSVHENENPEESAEELKDVQDSVLNSSIQEVDEQVIATHAEATPQNAAANELKELENPETAKEVANAQPVNKEAAALENESEEKAGEEKEEDGATRITDMIEPAMDGGDERVAKENESKKQAEAGHLESVSRKKTSAGSKGISTLNKNEKEKEEAGEKLHHTEEAVVEQKTEKVAEVNAQQVDAVDEVKTPEAKEDEAKKSFTTSLNASLPKTIEDVDEFKNRGKASKIGEQVQKTIEGKTKEISGTFEQLDKTQEPADPKKPIPFNELESALPTADLNVGKDLVPPVQKESVDLKSYVEESDNLLKREGIKEEHLNMVDSGDLFEAKTLKDDVKKKSTDDPSALRKEEKQLHKETEQHLQNEEKTQKQEMEKQRSAGLGGARDHQEGTKTAFEKKREEVTTHINNIYETTNTAVQEKLESLKKNSLAAFDREEAAASAAFEANVKYRMDKFKEKRYDGLWGTAKQVKDFFMGIDDMPEVKEIFESEKAAFIRKIDAAISKIISDSQKVIDECKALIAQARKDIEKYVSTLSPDLKKIGEDAQKEIQKKLDELDEKVNKAAEELKKELEKKRAEAIKKIDEKIEKMKEEMSGMLSKIGNLLLDAALKFFKWALESVGYSADQLMGIINKGKAVITAVVSDPIRFMKNLATAVGNGLKNFGANILTHLKEGFITWITGQMNSLPIQMPEKLDVKGVFSIALQVLGLTWDALRGKLSKKVGEDKVQMAEKSVEVVSEVKQKGPVAMYEHMKDQAEDVKTQVIEGAKEWAITSIIKNGLIKVASMLNPAGAIVQAILAIYNGVMFFVNNWQRIVDFVNSIFNSIANIASGALGAAAGFIEQTLAKTIPLILDFLARFIGLSGIADKIHKVIQKVRKPIDKAIDKVLNFIESKLKKLWGKISGKDKKKKGEAEKIKDKNKGEKPEELKPEDKDDHQKMGTEIKGKMDDAPTGKENFDDYYQKKKALAVKLEDQYQPKLKKGINLDITLEDKEKARKDGDITVKISIKPNDYVTTFELDMMKAEDGELSKEDKDRFAKIVYNAMRKVAGDKPVSADKDEIRKHREENDKKLKDASFSDEAKKKEAEALKEAEDKKKEEIDKDANAIQKKILNERAKYISACKAFMYPNNTFSVGGGTFFVETARNFYMYPTSSSVVTNFMYKIGSKHVKSILESEQARLQNALTKSSSDLTNNLKGLKARKAGLEAKGKSTEDVDTSIAELEEKIAKGETTDTQKKLQKLLDEITGKIGLLGAPENQNQIVEYIRSNVSNEDFRTFANYKDEKVTILVDDSKEKFDYGGNELAIETAKRYYKGFPGSIGNDKQSALFLAGLLAEPTRYSIAHISNILLLNEESTLTKPEGKDKKDTIFDHKSMTQKGSDPKAPLSEESSAAPKDERLNNPDNSHIVTDRDLASLKHNPSLMLSLEKIFRQKLKTKESDAGIESSFVSEMREYLKSK